MFDPNVLGNIHPLTVVYINHLLQPYVEALSQADSVESLIPWIEQVDPENAPEIISGFEGKELEDCKNDILYDLASNLNVGGEDYKTPWDISSSLNEKAIRLFGQSSTELPIIITTGDNSFQHELSQELTYGILVALNNNPNFSVSLFGHELSRDEFDFIYVKNNDEETRERFVVNHNGQLIAFGTNEFIQGVITAADWLDVDPHTLVTDLRYVDGDYNVTRYNF